MASASQPKVYFFFDEVRITLSNRGRLKKFIESLFKKESTKLASLNYIFCSDTRLLEINRTYLKHDYYTDIVSFGLSGKGEPVTGEIYISVDRVRDNANRLGVSIREELHRVIFHGALHLCGYRDKENREIEIMREKEAYYLQSYFD